MEKKIKILGIAGSLRTGSFNQGLLRAAVGMAGPEVEIEVFDLAPLPFYNHDIEADPPSIVKTFKEKIAQADAILLVTPEYNYSISGVLKNALDWGSRPNKDNSWSGKPVAIMGASTGSHGTSRAQYQLRQMFVTLNMYAMNAPEVMIASAKEKFDSNGNLTDETTKERVGVLLSKLVEWTKLLQRK